MQRTKVYRHHPTLMGSDKPETLVCGLRPIPQGLQATGTAPECEAASGGLPVCEMPNDSMLFDGAEGLVVVDASNKGKLVANGSGRRFYCGLTREDKAIVMAEDGALNVAQDGNKNWTAKPTRKRYPSLSFKTVGRGSYSMSVRSRPLSDDIADMRKIMAKDFAEAYKSLSSQVTAGGTFCAPVLAWARYLDEDGNILFTTPPVLLRGTINFEPYIETKIENNIAQAYTVTLPCYGIIASFDNSDCPEVADVEFMLSPQLHPYSSNGSSRIRIDRDTETIGVWLPGYGLNMKAGTAAHNRLLRLLGVLDNLGTANLRISRPFNGTSHTVEIGRCDSDDAASETKLVSGALKGLPVKPNLRDVVLRAPHSFVAQSVASDADTVAWANLTAMRFEGYSPQFFAHSGATGEWSATVSVNFDNDKHGVLLNCQGNGEIPTILSPILSYPSPDARKMCISIIAAGTIRYGEFALEPDASGLRAVNLSADLHVRELPVVDAAPKVSLLPADINYPDMVALAPASTPLSIDRIVTPGSGSISAISTLPGNDSAWEYGRCRFIVAGKGGLYSLTIDSKRKSAAARCLDTRTASGAGCLISCSEGVFAALNGGIVHVNVNNRRASDIDCEGSFYTLAWDKVHHELYAAGDGATAVYCPRYGGYYLRPDLLDATAGTCLGRPFVLADGATMMPDRANNAVTSTVQLDFEYQAAARQPFLPIAASLVMRGNIEEACAEISAGALRQESVGKLTFSGEIRSALNMRLLSRAVSNMHFHLQGDAESDFSIYEINTYGRY